VSILCWMIIIRQSCRSTIVKKRLICRLPLVVQALNLFKIVQICAGSSLLSACQKTEVLISIRGLEALDLDA
jgi:hypothetical protein